MKPSSVPPIRALTDRTEPTVSVDLQDLLPILIANIIGDAAYHPRIRAKAIAELSAASPIRTENRLKLATEIADEMREFGHNLLEFTPEQVEVILILLKDALEDLKHSRNT